MANLFQWFKNFIISLIIIGGSLSILVCTLNVITFTLLPAQNQTKTIVTLSNGEKSFPLNFNTTNTITFILSSQTPVPITLIGADTGPIGMDITHISAKNIFDKEMVNYNLKAGTILQEFLHDSKFIQISINQVPKPANPFSLVASVLFMVFIVLAAVFFLIYAFINVFMPNLLAWIDNIHDNKINPKCIYIFNILAITVVVFFSIWATFCGLLFGDEGYFNLMAKYPQDVLIALTGNFYVLTHLLSVIVNGNLILFRNCTLVLNFLSISLLTYAVQCLIPSHKYSFSKKLQTVIIFSLLFVTSSFQFIHHITPDYNNISRYIVFIQVSLLLILFYKDVLSIRAKYLCLFFLGFATGVNLFAKFPEFVCSLIVISAILKFYKVRFSIIIFVIGVLIAFVVYFSCLQSLPDFIIVQKGAFAYSKTYGGHSPVRLLGNNFLDIGIELAELTLILIIYHFCKKRLSRNYSENSIVGFFIISISTICLIHCFTYLNELTGYFIFISKALLAIFAILVYENIVRKRFFIENGMVCGAIFIFLYIASVGTDTEILYHIMFNISLLYIAILMQVRGSKSFFLFSTFLTVFAAMMVINGLIIESPDYNNLFLEKTEYKFSGSTVYLNKDGAADLNKIRTALANCDFHEGDYISGFYAAAQLIHAVGGRSPVTPWYSYGTNQSNIFIMQHISPEMQKTLFLIINKDMYKDGLGFNVIDDYQFCGEAKLSGVNAMIGGKDYAIYRHK